MCTGIIKLANINKIYYSTDEGTIEVISVRNLISTHMSDGGKHILTLKN